MSSTRILWLTSAAVLIVPQPALASPPDPLIVTPMADPDPGFVAPPPERHAAVRHPSAPSDPLVQAFENLGRITGQAAQIMQQRARSAAERAHTDELNRLADEAARQARH